MSAVTRMHPILLTATFATAVVSLWIATPAHAATGAVGGGVLPILLGLVVILVGALLGGAAFARFGQSPVLGELLAGLVLGNLGLVGFHGVDSLKTLPGLELLAELGVLFLLFEVGLESNVQQLLAVGGSSLLVALLGVITPMALGYGCSALFLPGQTPLTYVFVGAILCATSVGITARVLAGLGRTDSLEGRIILGAAVIDDVLGLIVLAVVSGIITAADAGRTFAPGAAALILAKAVGFLAGAIVIGRWISKRVFRAAGFLGTDGALLGVALAFCFTLAWLAGRLGLAPIVGAFAAGLVLDRAHYRTLQQRDPRNRDVRQLIEPLGAFLVPVFFVLMGMRVDLAVFATPGVLMFALALTVAAVLGKQVCGLGVLDRGVDRIAVGLGMIPRGEVGLIFAGIGTTLRIGGVRVVDDTVFAAAIVVIALTTFMTPPLLTWRFGRGRRASP